jgi:DoxX-like protein
MQTTADPAPAVPWWVWTGRILSGVAIVFLVADGAMKLVPLDVVVETQERLGFAGHLSRPLGVLLLACTALYAFPRTALLGAILLTGYLGGAIAIHLRAGSPLVSHLLFGAYLGLMVWGGLYLRGARLRALIPLR